MQPIHSNDLETVTDADPVVVPPTDPAKKPRASRKRVVKKSAKKTKAAKAAKAAKKAKSPQAQSGPALELPFEKMNKVEQKIVKAVYTPKGERKPHSIKDLMKAVGSKSSSPVRNGLRRPVRGGWLEKADRGTYRLTEKARKRGIAKGA